MMAFIKLEFNLEWFILHRTFVASMCDSSMEVSIVYLIDHDYYKMYCYTAIGGVNLIIICVSPAHESLWENFPEIRYSNLLRILTGLDEFGAQWKA